MALKATGAQPHGVATTGPEMPLCADIPREALHAPCPLSEYAARIARTRRSMSERNLDLVITSDPSNMAWLTGYDGWSFYVHQAVLLGLEGETVWWGRRMDGFVA